MESSTVMQKILQEKFTVIEKLDGKYNFDVNFKKTTEYQKKSDHFLIKYDEETRVCSMLYDGTIIAEGRVETDGKDKIKIKRNAIRNAKRSLQRYMERYCYKIRQTRPFYSRDPPINPPMKKNAAGCPNCYITDSLKKYKDNDKLYDLVFSTYFTREDIVKIVRLAKTMELESKIIKQEGSDLEFVVVSKKISPQQLRFELLKDDTLLRNKYELTMPKNTVQKTYISQ